MRTVITSKYQTTIPKKIREAMNISIKDTIEWKIEDGKIVIVPLKKKFLDFKDSIKVGPGNIDNDIKLARKLRLKKYQ
ncbi:MAG: AbrB family transcriptional regulator [Deltaproteobacteria bacterium]|nr:MAG: AbrB family transcriptional regulator [Deltaproteobacteria bacterium]RLB04831.1 MAG: AbrB family transcriptional regulator [Deltaproteobacteria bacterium]